jgi:lantibiotic modifying enzyme
VCTGLKIIFPASPWNYSYACKHTLSSMYQILLSQQFPYFLTYQMDKIWCFSSLSFFLWISVHVKQELYCANTHHTQIHTATFSANPNTITNSMKQSPSWEANSHSASPEIPHLLWNPKLPSIC